jgi:magnesium-transporting ATPase (P-type)
MGREKTPDDYQQSEARPPDRRTIIAFGIGFAVLTLFLAYFLVAMWPESGIATNATVRLFGGWHISPSAEQQLLLVVLAAGALGACIHATTSFVHFLGKRSFKRSWTWWYLLRPFIGMSLAAVIYFVLRGGLFTTGAGPGDVNNYGVAAIAGLAGMFSRQAIDKLKDVFDTLFASKADEARGDKDT